MVQPDSIYIAEILLYSAGFVNAHVLARKISRTFSISVEQLSSEKHYDFGLRTIKEVLEYAQ
jgi:dynein heavy chain, axonemal